MAQYNELPVYKATYDLLLAIFQFTKDFSKEYKYTVGESLKKETIDPIIASNPVESKNKLLFYQAYIKTINPYLNSNQKNFFIQHLIT